MPEKRATQLLEDYDISSVSELSLEELASSEFLIVEEADLQNHIGRISFGADYGLIKIDSKIKEPGQKRFTLAHEVGHYFNEKDFKISRTYKCTADDIFSFKINKRREDNANVFAAELLMHRPWFNDFTKSRKINFELIKEVSKYFNVSLSAAAIRYANIGKYPIAVILSREGKAVWSCTSDYFPFKWIPRGYKLRNESAAFDFFAGNEVQICEDLIPAYAWFSEDFNCRKDVYLYEQNVVMKNYNSVLTLLWESEFK